MSRKYYSLGTINWVHDGFYWGPCCSMFSFLCSILCPFFFGSCIVCLLPLLITPLVSFTASDYTYGIFYRFWLHLWYLQTFLFGFWSIDLFYFQCLCYFANITFNNQIIVFLILKSQRGHCGVVGIRQKSRQQKEVLFNPTVSYKIPINTSSVQLLTDIHKSKTIQRILCVVCIGF